MLIFLKLLYELTTMRLLVMLVLVSISCPSTVLAFQCHECGLLEDKDGKIIYGSETCAAGQASKDVKMARGQASNNVIHLKPLLPQPGGSSKLPPEEGCIFLVFSGTSFEHVNETATVPKPLKTVQRGGIRVEGFPFPDGCTTKKFGEWSKDSSTDAWAYFVAGIGWGWGFQPDASVMACGCPKNKCGKAGNEYIYGGTLEAPLAKSRMARKSIIGEAIRRWTPNRWRHRPGRK